MIQRSLFLTIVLYFYISVGYTQAPSVGPVDARNFGTTQFTAKGGNTPRTLADRFAQIVDVMDYGAKCDDSTDDATAINAAVSQVRNLITLNVKAAVVLEFPPSIPDGNGGITFRRCRVHSSLNLTGIYSTIGNVLNVSVEGNGTVIYGQMVGSPIIDALGSNEITWHHLGIFSDNSNIPSFGIQIGRTIDSATDYGGGANMRFDDVTVDGYYSTAAFYNFAGEEVVLTRPRILNQNTTAGTYGYIADGFNHFNITSAFVTETAAVDTAQSFEETTVLGGSLQGSGTSSMWMGGVTQHRLINVYAHGSSNTSCITLYNESAGIYGGMKGLDLDVHCEGSALTKKILISGSLSAPVIRDLTLRDVYEFSTGSIFALDSGVTSATLENPNVSISGGPSSPVFTMFDTPSAYTTIGGNFYVYAASAWVPPGNLFSSVAVPGFTQHNANQMCATAGTLGNNTSRSYQSAVACTTMLKGQVVTGTTPVRLTTDGAAASSTNCANLPPTLQGSLSTARVNVVARDRNTATTYAAWADWPIIYGNTVDGPSNTFVTTGTKPTPTTAGTVTGTDIAVSADTTNGCLNVSWTPPNSNTELWDVAASVAFTRVR